jgi:hypothetical protein
MFYKTLAAAAVTIALAGGAYAQSTPVTPENIDPSAKEGNFPQTTGSIDRTDWTSDAERSWYEENRDRLAAFFADDTMVELRADPDIGETFAAMGAEDQDEIRAACDRVQDDRGSYGNVTVTLCSQIGEL